MPSGSAPITHFGPLRPDALRGAQTPGTISTENRSAGVPCRCSRTVLDLRSRKGHIMTGNEHCDVHRRSCSFESGRDQFRLHRPVWVAPQEAIRSLDGTLFVHDGAEQHHWLRISAKAGPPSAGRSITTPGTVCRSGIPTTSSSSGIGTRTTSASTGRAVITCNDACRKFRGSFRASHGDWTNTRQPMSQSEWEFKKT
jgi:hypothetical protein